jgi:hypothetical protein
MNDVTAGALLEITQVGYPANGRGIVGFRDMNATLQITRSSSVSVLVSVD